VTGSEAAKVVRTVLCRGLTLEQAEQIIAAMVAVNAAPGTVVMRQGERGGGLLVLLEGTAEILKRGDDGRDVVITTVPPPALLGEMSLVSERPHSATVRAGTTCEFRLLTRTQFDRLLKAENVAAYKVVATLASVIAHRLERMDEKVAELTQRAARPTPASEPAS
jgi:CRP-like cAMP-binding protein